MDEQGRDALMIARGFKSVIWVATVGSAALGCYMVSLRVATERGELAKVERQIIAAKRDIRSLQTELGTRGRMTQLEQWNSEVLALSAPNSSQFLKDEFTLARLYRNDPTVADRSAEVHLASAEAPAAKPVEPSRPAAPAVISAVAEPAAEPSLVHRASFTPAAAEPRPAAAKPGKPAAERTPPATPVKPKAAAAQPAAKPGKPQRTASAAPARPEATPSRPTGKPVAKPVAAAAKPVREAAAAASGAKAKGTGGR
jgi:hypothetical protein